MESLSQLLRRTIRTGAPLYNKGDHEGCYTTYLEAAQDALNTPAVAVGPTGKILSIAVTQAQNQSKSSFDQAAWIFRRAFDEVLATGAGKKLQLKLDAESVGSSEEDFYWQDEKVEKNTDLEKGQALANVGLILKSKAKLGQHTRDGVDYKDAVVGSSLVEELTSMSLANCRDGAVTKLTNLLHAGFLVSATSTSDEFQDGTEHLYQFATQAKLEESFEAMKGKPEADIVGSTERMLVEALRTLVESSGDTRGKLEKISSGRIPQRKSEQTKEQIHGAKIAERLANLVSELDIKERRHKLKKYPDCFVGKDAVDAMERVGLAESRAQAVEQLDETLQAGLIHHVTREHAFEDKSLFYRVTQPGDIKAHLDALDASEGSGSSTVQREALRARYSQFATLDIPDILNSFFGCKSEEGWDLVDLQNWRTNMKRWGFGRREDQDDGMVDHLSPLLLSVDPTKWDVTGDEKWESPFGILAQIAIFDQVSRSAFRGTADAFAWDELAIRASKVAIEKGYFDNAYKSTLNQFLILLPLEHSEDWEDQKLGVSLIMRLLSKVSIEDVGHSDYEIVKRLEFSKRLTTAFLEHAQVIAKFKRYPHRNRPLGRSTTLEERVWLASDLVPRWAQSQNPDDARTVLQLPVIPLKRLTRGR